VEESGGEIVFRRRLVEEAAAESYGIHVARLAGLSDGVLLRAEQLMLEQAVKPAPDAGPAVFPVRRAGKTAWTPPPETSLALRELAELDVIATSPLEALHLICRWKTLANKDGLPPPQQEKQSARRAASKDHAEEHPPAPPPQPDLFADL
jgi:DNA mismatch repair protein MutS